MAHAETISLVPILPSDLSNYSLLESAMSLKGKCPDEFYCSDGSHGFSVINGTALNLIPVYAGIASAILSVLGGVLIIFAYCAFKDLRKGAAQTIITLLAIADVGTAASLMLGVINFLVYEHHHSDRLTSLQTETLCWNFYIICQIQAFIMVGCAIASYIWTAILAIHFLLSTVFTPTTNWNKKLMPLYNIVAWTLPIVFLLPLLGTGKLGYTPTYPVACLFSNVVERHKATAMRIVENLVTLSAEAVCGIITVVCYVIILGYMCIKVL